MHRIRIETQMKEGKIKVMQIADNKGRAYNDLISKVQDAIEQPIDQVSKDRKVEDVIRNKLHTIDTMSITMVDFVKDGMVEEVS